MTDRELMQQALEAMESAKYGMAECRQEIGFDFANEQYDVEQAITALRERLAQPEQEPVIDKSAAIRIATALGWKPRQWVGLTDEEIRFIAWGDFGVDQEKHLAEVLPLARAIEAKLREKNA